MRNHIYGPCLVVGTHRNINPPKKTDIPLTTTQSSPKSVLEYLQLAYRHKLLKWRPITPPSIFLEPFSLLFRGIPCFRVLLLFFPCLKVKNWVGENRVPIKKVFREKR